jgi:hypothetical protein
MPDDLERKGIVLTAGGDGISRSAATRTEHDA